MTLAVVEGDGPTIHFRVRHAHIVMDDESASFMPHGILYSKSGTLGMRSQLFFILLYTEEQRAWHCSTASDSFSRACQYFRYSGRSC